MDEFNLADGDADNAPCDFISVPVHGEDNDVEIDGESFHVEDFEPTAEEYRELVGGVFRDFYEEDVKNAVKSAIEAEREKIYKSVMSELDEKEKSIRDEARRETIEKIAKRRLRPAENGLSGQHIAPKRDVSKMTKEERAQAARRAASGLIINLK